MEFFSGFKWAVPLAFSEAVSRCFFKEGDVLYDSPTAYDANWEEAIKNIEYYLQVRYPPRFTRGTTEKESESIKKSVFARNWNSEVRLDLYKNQEMVEEQKETSQGRLYTALWKGDIGILERNSEAPQIPIPVNQVTRNLGEASQTAKKLSGGDAVFVMARDRTNLVSTEKYRKVLSKLRRHLAGEPKLLRPQSAGLSDWIIIAPTIDIAFFQTKGVSADKLHDLVEEALHEPGKGAMKKMFRISAHGTIF